MARFVAVLLIVSALITGVSPAAVAQEATPASEYPPRNLSLLEGLGLPEINLVATATEVTGAPSEVEAGRYFVTLDNQSLDDEVEVYFVVVPEGVTQEQALADLNANTNEGFPWFYEATWAGGPNSYLGQKDGAVVELAPGDWFIAIDRAGADGPAGNAPDTATPLHVTGDLAAGEEVAGAVPVGMKDFAFELPDSIPAGPQIWDLTNDGPQPHFLAVARVPNGTTIDQVTGLINFAVSGTPEAGSLGFEQVLDIYDSSIISTGQRTWIQMDLEPGTYIAVCFLPDAATQAPHAMLGMTQLFTVSAAEGASPVASAYSFETTITTDGRGLHLACVGTGSPTVVIDIGGPNLDGGVASMAPAVADIAAALGTRFCAYDRAGSGQSDADPMGVRTLQEAAADLGAVLAAPELECPCVVLGESLGGGIALVALAQDASGFAGLVVIDAPYPGYIDTFLSLAPAGAPEAGMESEPYFIGENEERLDLVNGFRQITEAESSPGIPVVVIAHGQGDPPPCFPCSDDYPVEEFEAAWQAGQAALATSLGGRLVVAEDNTHFIAEENPGLVIGLAAEVIAAVRDPSTWVVPAASPAA